LSAIGASIEPDAAPSGGSVPQLTETLFRHESGKLVSALTASFGIEHLQLAEDVVQEAMVRALKTWPYYGIPKNPAAWLMQTARNLALDVIRRQKRFSDKQTQIAASFEEWGGDSSDAPALDSELKDHRLRLMFACCHPLIPPEAQAALALKTLCGFSPGEIAKAFLTSEAAIAKRLVRARQRIREQQIPFEIPAGAELVERLEGVLQTLYLLFNEGYKASSGESLIREELCMEAIHLTSLLVEHPVGNQPRTHALIALMCLNAARLPARIDTDGNMLRLREQDRESWNQAMIVRGMRHLGMSASGDLLSSYHLEAGIAACHATAPDYESTDWVQILALYDRLVQLDASPIIALNRAVALANVEGPDAGISAVEAIRNRQPLGAYYLYYAVLAEFESQRSNFESAAAHLREAVRLTDVKSEHIFLSKKLREAEAGE
jgi:RNA polymerase sigma factor (sigma-70 family)